jgi:ABC-type lipoprotein export system ATPase subunit
LAVSGLRFGYRRGGPAIFDGLNASFASGAVTAVTGPSGGGKSTLLYLLGLLLRPETGRISEDGRALSALDDSGRSTWRANRVGFVFQDAVLDPARTIVDNVCEGGFYAGLPGGLLRDKAAELLERAGVIARFDHRPGEISGGQAQRVALCRALVKNPAVVLADEPSGNLDSESADVVWAMLRQAAAQGACVIVATHDRARAGACDERLFV